MEFIINALEKEFITQSKIKTMNEQVSFGKALEALKQGKRVQRIGWNGKDMFVFQRPSDKLTAEFIIEKVKYLPQSVKDYYVAQFTHNKAEEERGESPKDVEITFTAYLCMKAADGSIVNGWLASQTDMLAEDWLILD